MLAKIALTLLFLSMPGTTKAPPHHVRFFGVSEVTGDVVAASSGTILFSDCSKTYILVSGHSLGNGRRELYVQLTSDGSGHRATVERDSDDIDAAVVTIRTRTSKERAARWSYRFPRRREQLLVARATYSSFYTPTTRRSRRTYYSHYYRDVITTLDNNIPPGSSGGSLVSSSGHVLGMCYATLTSTHRGMCYPTVELRPLLRPYVAHIQSGVFDGN